MKNKEDAIGVSLEDAKYVSTERLGSWIDISQGIKNVENNLRVHPWVRWGHHTQFAFNPLEPRRAQIEQPWFDFASPMSSASRQDRARDMMSRRERESNPNYQNPPKYKPTLGDGSSIMRTYEMDIELRSHDDISRGIMFEKVIDQIRPSQAVLPSMRMAHERLANLIHVPELSLVVAASLCGRVALVTLTRPMDRGLSFKRAFRVDAILPTASDEDKQKRPICPLLGVAIGPVPFSGSPELAERPISPRPYRIMLHFYDLSILSYDISRCPATDSLSISWKDHFASLDYAVMIPRVFAGLFRTGAGRRLGYMEIAGGWWGLRNHPRACLGKALDRWNTNGNNNMNENEYLGQSSF